MNQPPTHRSVARVLAPCVPLGRGAPVARSAVRLRGVKRRRLDRPFPFSRLRVSAANQRCVPARRHEWRSLACAEVLATVRRPCPCHLGRAHFRTGTELCESLALAGRCALVTLLGEPVGVGEVGRPSRRSGLTAAAAPHPWPSKLTPNRLTSRESNPLKSLRNRCVGCRKHPLERTRP